MREQKTKVGLLGSGNISEAHARAVRELPHARLHAVCDASRSRAQRAADEYGARHVFTSIEELAASDCDAVHVLLPPQLHADATRRLLEGGKHVFVEKPMALGAVECEQLVELAATRGLRLGVNHNFLFAPAYEKLRDQIRRGVFGRLDHLAVDWMLGLGLLKSGPYDHWMLRSPQNLLYEVGPHLAAFVIDLVGRPESVIAAASHPLDLPGAKRVHRHWNAVAWAEGTSISFNLSLAPGPANRRVYVRGSAASAELDFARNTWVTRKSASTNPIFDDFQTGRAAGRQLSAQAWRNIRGYLVETLRKSARSDPFGQSIAASVAAFHSQGGAPLDSRIDGRFAVGVIELLDRISEAAGWARAPGAPAAAARVPERSGAAVASSRQLTGAGVALVVGGTGFIGKHLIRALRAAGYRVRVLTRNRAAAEIELDDPTLEIVEGEHGDPEALGRALPGVDVVYHLAKALGRKWEDFLRNDVEPTAILAEAALRHGVKRFVYTGTIDSYHSARPHDVIDGDTGVDPRIELRNDYARSKAQCEALLTRLHRERGLPLVIFRPGMVIGEGSPPLHWGVGMSHSEARLDFWGDGRNKLPFVLVDDVADALVRAASAPGIEGHAFLLTSPPLMSAQEYVEEVSRLSGTLVDARPHPIWRFYAADLVKEAVKHLIRHPNRRTPTLRDWSCRAHRARYDSSRTVEVLGWKPAATRAEIVERGIRPPVVHSMR